MEKDNKNLSPDYSLIKKNRDSFPIDSLLKKSAKWLDASGSHSDIVISSRVRLARNIEGFHFPNRADSRTLAQVMDILRDWYDKIDELNDAIFLNMNTLSELDRQFLMERHLISPHFIKQKRPAGLIISKDELISIMINEEDHLRIQSLQSGLEIEKAWQVIHRIDDALSKNLDYAFSDQFGFLTACPTNTGTGIRISIFINLPALAISSQIENIIRDIAPSEIAIRGFYGEGTDVMGNFFQISNQITLGRTEQSIINRITNIAEQLIAFEQNARKELMHNKSIIVEDQIARAIGILKYAQMMNSVEVINHLSMLRLGVGLGIVKHINKKDLNELLVLIQPAHLQKLYEQKLDSNERDNLRIKLIRNRLKL